MTTTNKPRVRRSLTELQDEYKSGHKKPLEDLMRAWKGIKALPPEEARSFFRLGGYHGEPFRGAGWGNGQYWGGYCNHGNVLFPLWHRVYLVKLEDALRSIPGCEDVTLPFWDECSQDSVDHGIPWALTAEKFELDGEVIDNPLRSFTFNRNIKDHVPNDPQGADYSKPKGYETVRYPLSGLVGTEADREATQEHNAQFKSYEECVTLLDQNIRNWLGSHIVVNGKPVATNVAKKYKDCLNAPNYTVFSNTTSAAEWNDNVPEGEKPVTPLESPHNDIHLAVGGFDVPNQTDFSPIAGANGDMGENDTAALDPIFYFHHAFVDRVFWLWQKRHHREDHLEVIAEYPGTNTVDNQGPTPGMPPNSWLDLDSPLNPFVKVEDGKTRVYTSRDILNIEKQLGYTYGKGSLEDVPERAAPAPDNSSKLVCFSKFNRAPMSGSFLVSLYAIIEGKRQRVATEAVLSRWSVKYCANCQTHLEVRAFFGMHDIPAAALADGYEIEIHTRQGLYGPTHPAAQLLSGKRQFLLDVR